MTTILIIVAILAYGLAVGFGVFIGSLFSRVKVLDLQNENNRLMGKIIALSREKKINPSK